MRRLLDKDPITGETTYFHWLEAEQKFAIETEQDVSPILEANKTAANDDDKTRRGIKNDFWLYARIPNVVQMRWLNEKGVDINKRAHRRRVFQLLNDPEYKYLKTTAKHHEER